MARRSILSPVRDQQHTSPEPVAQAETSASAEIVRVPAASTSSRYAKLHVGGYFDPGDPILIRFKSSRSISGDPNRTCCWKRFGISLPSKKRRARSADAAHGSRAPANDHVAASRRGQGRRRCSPLNFRFSADFRCSFKTYAARHDPKLNDCSCDPSTYPASPSRPHPSRPHLSRGRFWTVRLIIDCFCAHMSTLGAGTPCCVCHLPTDRLEAAQQLEADEHHDKYRFTEM